MRLVVYSMSQPLVRILLGSAGGTSHSWVRHGVSTGAEGGGSRGFDRGRACEGEGESGDELADGGGQ